MRQVNLEQFTKFSKDFIKSKMNKCISVIEKDGNEVASQRLKSKLLQLKKFDPPSLSQLNSSEWEFYKGRELTRRQAKIHELLMHILPYETEARFNLNVVFNDGNESKRGNLILPDSLNDAPIISFMKDQTNSDMTFILADCDHPFSTGNVGPYLLWKIDNIGTDSEKITHPYIPPHPERGSGVHRIVAVLLKGRAENISDREGLDFHKLVENGGEIISYNFFQTMWTKSVSEELKRLNIRERIFGQFIPSPGRNNDAI